MINSNSDTIDIHKTFYGRSKPFHLPWHVIAGDKHFYCYDPLFSKFILESIPSDFNNSSVFSNTYLLIKLAYYLKPD